VEEFQECKEFQKHNVNIFLPQMFALRGEFICQKCGELI
jgi:formylmethanofuran dehydrogenase subunit E